MQPCPECGGSVGADDRFCLHCGTALTEASHPGHPSEVLERLHQELRQSVAPRFELLQLLGEGAMGAVFLAREPALKRQVAIKVLTPALSADPPSRARFHREARAAAALSHPNIVNVYSVGETAESHVPYIVMQFVDGPSLATWVRERRAVGEREARRILAGVAQGLAAAHARGLVHRDVKPGNVLIEAGTGRPLVADFGIAAVVAPDAPEDATALTATGQSIGTPVYMSPEQAAAEPVGPASDVYSLGIVAYELLAGKLPFDATSAMSWAAAHLRDIPPPISQIRADVSPEIAQLVDRCLAKDPRARPTAQQVAEAMLPSPETEVQWPPPGLHRLFGRGRTVARFAWATAAASVVLLLALAVPPGRVRTTGSWWEHFEGAVSARGSVLGVRSEVPETTEGLPAWWLVALSLGLTGGTGGFFGLLGVSYATCRAAGRCRARGWRWSTLEHVVADPDGRSGLLLAGTRECASLPRERCLDILKARRAQLRGAIFAGVWALTALGLWAFLVVRGVWPLRGAGPVAGLATVLVVALPVLLATGRVIEAARQEARFFRPLPRRRAHTGTFTAVAQASGSREVAAWYAELPGGLTADAPPPLWRARALALLHPAAGFAALLLVLALAAVTAAVVIGGRNAQRLGPETAALLTALARLDLRDPVADARAVWTRYLPTPSPAPPAAARDWARALEDRDPAAVPGYPVSPAQVLGTYRAESGESGGWIGRTLPSDTARLFDALASHPRTQVLRRLAHARDIDLFAAVLDQPLREYGSLADLPELPYGPLREATQANALGAALSVSHRDLDAAVARLGENAALAEHLLRVPRLFANRFGAGLLQDLALLPLAQVEELRGNDEQSAHLRAAAQNLRDHVYGEVWTRGMPGLAADPRHLDWFARSVADVRLLPGLRVESLAGGFAGLCFNPREILTGPSPERRRAMLLAAEEMHDVPTAPGLAQLAADAWEPASLVAAPTRPRWLRVAGSWPSGVVLARLVSCAKIVG